MHSLPYRSELGNQRVQFFAAFLLFRYSGLPPKDKQLALDLWNKKWESFIHQAVKDMSLENE